MRFKTRLFLRDNWLNPLYPEAILRISPYIQNALVFGRSRPYSGVILSPTDLGRELAPGELVKAVWPQLLQANEFAPSHSRIIPEVIALRKVFMKMP